MTNLEVPLARAVGLLMEFSIIELGRRVLLWQCRPSLKSLTVELKMSFLSSPLTYSGPTRAQLLRPNNLKQHVGAAAGWGGDAHVP